MIERGGFVLIDYDELTGKEVWIREQDGIRTVRTVMPVDDILDANAAAQVDNLNRPWGDVAPVASIPMHIWQREIAPAIMQEDEAYIKRWLNDADHAKFRTRGGRV